MIRACQSKKTPSPGHQQRAPLLPTQARALNDADELSNLMSKANISSTNKVNKKHHPNHEFYATATCNDSFARADVADSNFINCNNDHNDNVESETIDWDKEREEMDVLFDKQAAEKLKFLRPFSPPKQFKKTTKLFPHQKQGISWLVQQECSPPANPFVFHRMSIKTGNTIICDRLTRKKLQQHHAPVNGSILADDMGVGKTIQTLGLILSNPPTGHVYGQGAGSSIQDSVCSLIVCKVSLISTWLEQIEQFVEPGTLRIVVYNGNRKQRSKIIERVQKNEVDILLATYGVVEREHMDPMTDNRGNPLLDIHSTSFHRVVLDEAQEIRNGSSKTCQAIMSVANSSKYRLALTGTPFVNSPDDIHSLLGFCGLEPMADTSIFKRFVTEEIKARKRIGLTRLRMALGYCALRRTKRVLNDVNMMEKSVQVLNVAFPENSEHKRIHDILYDVSRYTLEAAINGEDKDDTESEEGITSNLQRSLFEMALRVRQSCDSGALVPIDRLERAASALTEMKDDDGGWKTLTAQKANELLATQLGKDADTIGEDKLYRKDLPHSPKVCALLQAIEEMAKDEKAVVFSQWAGFLDEIERALRDRGYRTARIDGTKTIEQRTLAMQSLANDEDVRIMLCTLKTGGLGINLTRANVVFMMDPWWNDAIESQAIDRCHRVGQTRNVRVYRLVVTGTIEERMLNIQKAKSALGKGVLERLNREEEKVAKMCTLKDLFQITAKVKDGDDFIEDDDGDWF